MHVHQAARDVRLGKTLCAPDPEIAVRPGGHRGGAAECWWQANTTPLMSGWIAPEHLPIDRHHDSVLETRERIDGNAQRGALRQLGRRRNRTRAEIGRASWRDRR